MPPFNIQTNNNWNFLQNF